jgi:hypothetical protein
VSHQVIIIAARLSKLKISPQSFKSQGAEVSFKLDVGAPVRFTVQQTRPGRLVGTGANARCVKETSANRNKPRCKRTVTLPGHITIKGHAGSNHFHFSGRLGGKTLALGSYKLVATPTGGRPVSAAFHITAG